MRVTTFGPVKLCLRKTVWNCSYMMVLIYSLIFACILVCYCYTYCYIIDTCYLCCAAHTAYVRLVSMWKAYKLSSSPGITTPSQYHWLLCLPSIIYGTLKACGMGSVSFPIGDGSPPQSSPGSSTGVSDHFGSGGWAWSTCWLNSVRNVYVGIEFAFYV